MMRNLLMTLLLVMLSITLSATATQFVRVDFPGPYYLRGEGDQIEFYTALDYPLGSNQRIGLDTRFNNPAYITNVTCENVYDNEYRILIDVAGNPDISSRGGDFRISIQTYNSGNWGNGNYHQDSLHQYGGPLQNPYQAAINAASDGSTITIPAGVSYGGLEIVGKNNITIKGAGSGLTTIEGCGFRSAIKISGSINVTIKDLTITSGQSNNGAGIYCSGSATIKNCIIRDNYGVVIYTGGMPSEGSFGGAVYSAGGLTLDGCILYNNEATIGKVSYNARNIQFNNCTIIGTTSTSNFVNEWGGPTSFWNCIVRTGDVSANNTFNYCCRYPSGSFVGNANIAVADPMFVNAAARNYALADNSPCIGKGYNAAYDDPNVAGYDQNLLTIRDETQEMGAVPYAMDRYAKYSFTNDPQGNWMCFPVIDHVSTKIVGGITYQADNMKAFFSEYLGNQSVMNRVDFRWYDASNVFGARSFFPSNPLNWHTMRSFLGYKAIFTQNRTMQTIHGQHISYDTHVEVPVAEVENWVGYFIPQTQTVEAAFGDYLDELYYIQHKNWTMVRVKPQRGSSWLISLGVGQSLPTLSYGDMVVIKRFSQNGINNFAWHMLTQAKEYARQAPSYFSYEATPNYVPVFVQLDSPSQVKELAVMVDDTCYGAAVVEDSLVMIQAFIDSIPDGAEMQIVSWDGSRAASTPLTFSVYDSQIDQFLPASKLIKQACDFYYTQIGKNNQSGSAPIVTDLSVSNYPNPFNPSTTIRYGLPKEGNVRIGIYNVKGQLVKAIVEESKKAGMYTTVWNGEDQHGSKVSSGVYFLRIEANGKNVNKKILMMK